MRLLNTMFKEQSVIISDRVKNWNKIDNSNILAQYNT
jgi:hypothetical protein